MHHTQIRAFEAVVRNGRVSAAAQELGITQPAVSIQVRALERQYGITLFRRQGRRIVPTQAGRELFDIAHAIFAAEAGARGYLEGSASLRRGHLVLSADGPHGALDLLEPFMRQYPGIKVSLRLGNATETHEALLSGQVDAVAIANLRANSRIRTVPLRRTDMLAIVARGHPLANVKKASLATIARYPVLLREPGSLTRRLLEGSARREKVRLNPVLELGSREAIREAAARGFGVGFLFGREAEGDSRILAIPIRGLEGSCIEVLAWLKAAGASPVIRALVQVAKSTSGDPGEAPASAPS